MLKQKKTDLISILEKFSQVRVIVVGDVMLDRFTWGRVSRISPEAPVPVVEVTKECFMPGGASNVSANISALTGQSVLCGIIGSDTYGEMLSLALKKKGIEDSSLITDDNRVTTVKDRIIASQQQVLRVDREDISPISEKQCKNLLSHIKKAIPLAQVIVIEDYGKGVVTRALIEEVIKEARESNLLIAVDPKDDHFDHYTHVDIITPNHHEAEKATGIAIKDTDSLHLCGATLIEKTKCRAALITQGEQGMTLFQKDKEPFHISTVAKDIFDVSGAGDSVVATLSLALGAGASFEEAALLSNIAGGIVVEKMGVATLTNQEIKDKLCASLD
ncbi:hypothetical protein AB834_05715 [PVC group bacterium (ex Bugula neritina AB1)]|nr:hypothetical protein AB834_05715 [PVC group bacterium (ex Bugula neritina AB1)]